MRCRSQSGCAFREGWQQRATYLQLRVNRRYPEDNGNIADRGWEHLEPPEGLLVDLGGHDLWGRQVGGWREQGGEAKAAGGPARESFARQE